MSKVYEEQTYAVFGDVHAHISPLVKALVYLGWDEETLRIPENLIIVQLGDLIHKGPQTNKIIALVDKIMEVNNDDPECGEWVQLLGNHESQYLSGPVAFWKQECDLHSIDTLNRWWSTGRMKLHYVIEQNSGKPYVITHAGVNPFWYYRSEPFFKSGAKGIDFTQDDYMEFRESQTVRRFSAWLDELVNAPAVACLPGSMLDGKFNPKAGPVWAETVREVYSSWRGEEIPFHQIHGHVTPFSWTVRKFFPLVPDVIKKEMILFKAKRRSLWVNSDGTEFYGIDNGFGRGADLERMRPIMLTANGVVESDKDTAYFVNQRGKLEKTQS